MITSIVGKIGSGKSFKQLHYALSQCNSKRKRLVTNFALNLVELKRYAALMKYGWLGHLIDSGQIACVDAVSDLTSLLVYPNSVVCLDEAGIFLNAREFSKTPKEFLLNLAQSRKDGIDLIYAAQFDEQIDKQMRLLTQYFIYADGITVYDKKLKRPCLKIKKYHYFDAEAYFQWNTPKNKSSIFRTLFHSFRSEFGPLTASDLQLFNCFDSFARLEKQAAAARSIEPRPVPSDSSVLRRQAVLAARHRETKRFLWGAVELPPNF